MAACSACRTRASSQWGLADVAVDHQRRSLRGGASGRLKDSARLGWCTNEAEDRSAVPLDHIEQKFDEKSFVPGFGHVAEGLAGLRAGLLGEPLRSRSHDVDAAGLDKTISNPTNV